MAEDDEGLVGVEFGVGAGGDLAHGDERGAGDVGGDAERVTGQKRAASYGRMGANQEVGEHNLACAAGALRTSSGIVTCPFCVTRMEQC